MEAVRMVLICLDHPLFMKSSDYVNFTRTRKFDLHHAVHHGISPRGICPRCHMSAWLAANRGDKQELCRELDSGADMEFRDPMGRTALMEAAKHGHVDCVHELLCRGADPTARSAVGWTASDFCGSHESQHGEINRLLGEAQMMWQQDRDKQHSQQILPHQDSNKENNDSQLQIELPGYSTPSPNAPAGTRQMFRSYSSQDEPTQYRVEEPAHFGMPQQQQHYQLQPQQQQQQQQLFQHPLLNPMLSQGMLAQATMARLSQAGSEPANSSLSSSMLSIRSSELSNGSNLSRELGLLPADTGTLGAVYMEHTAGLLIRLALHPHRRLQCNPCVATGDLALAVMAQPAGSGIHCTQSQC
ncbi:hypothetical protein WJX79_008946 [Trebouxia sp. C0005]